MALAEVGRRTSGPGAAELLDPAAAEALVADGREDVVLLHGLGRSARVMRPLARQLEAAGYRVQNLEYPSTRATPEELVEVLHAEISRCCAWSGRVSFVTHSLGGVMVRAYLAQHPMPQLGRVVMLAPPNHGSEYVDIAGHWRLFQAVLGPTAAQLGTNPASLPNRLPRADYEVGVIAGTGSINPLGQALIAGANDGTVSVASTQLAGMRDWIELPVSHTFIMRNAEVARQTIAFLRAGHFAR
ncbi:MAG TPA: alpha/beta hydrolase [Myxococcota bacterium]|nr:alpha/beta hydrolase [Myxococcota bacterium]